MSLWIHSQVKYYIFQFRFLYKLESDLKEHFDISMVTELSIDDILQYVKHVLFLVQQYQ